MFIWPIFFVIANIVESSSKLDIVRGHFKLAVLSPKFGTCLQDFNDSLQKDEPLGNSFLYRSLLYEFIKGYSCPYGFNTSASITELGDGMYYFVDCMREEGGSKIEVTYRIFRPKYSPTEGRLQISIYRSRQTINEPESHFWQEGYQVFFL